MSSQPGPSARCSNGPVDEPVACTLGAADLAAQRRRWLALIDRAGAGRERVDDGVVLRFRHESGVENELRALAAVEAECCAWATWAVERADGEVVLHASARGEGVAALHGMFAAR
jgi:hypothetical protein